LLFFRGLKCKTDYKARAGKYQNQEAKVVMAKV
jgi:hypothetical protein